jgi:hypothetical protein
MSVQLYTNRTFIIEDVQFFDALDSITNQSIGRDEFGIHHIRPELLADIPEGGICNVFHGRKEDGIIA